MDTITIDDFAKVDIRAGKIRTVSEVEGSEKLYELKVDFGELGQKTVLSGIKKWYLPADLEGKTYLFVTNLEPRELMGKVSEAMILALTDSKTQKVVLVKPKTAVVPGSSVS